MPWTAQTPLVNAPMNILTAAQQGLELGQEEEQVKEQKALREIFAKADTSTPEGQADLIRQVQRVSPQAAMQLQAQQQKAKESQATIAKEGAQTKEAQAKTGQIETDIFSDYQNYWASNIKDISGRAKASAGTALPGTPTYDAAVKRANEEIDKAAGTAREKYGSNEKILQNLQEVDKQDYTSLAELEQDAQRMSARGQQQKQTQGAEPPKTIIGPNGQPVINPAYENFLKAEHQARETTPSEAAAKAGAEEAARAAAKSKAEGWTADEKDLLASLAQYNVNLPTGMRSKDQIHATLQGLIKKNPTLSPDEIAQGIRSGKVELTALTQEARTAGSVVGKTSLAINEIDTFAPLAIGAIDKVPRGSFMPINKLLRSYEEGVVQDPSLRTLAVYTTSLLNAYDQLASRGGTDVAKREEARKLLTTADSPETYKAAIAALKQEGIAAKKAATETIGEASGRPEKKKSETVHWDDLK